MHINISPLAGTKKKWKRIPYNNYIFFQQRQWVKEGIGLLVHRKYEYLIEDIVLRNTDDSLTHPFSRFYCLSTRNSRKNKNQEETVGVYKNQSHLTKLPANSQIIILRHLNDRVGNELFK